MSISNGSVDMKRPRRLLFGAGLLLLILETAKQIYLYTEVFKGSYNIWYLPFQLCSMPMYLCLAYPVLDMRGKAGLKTAAATFMQDYGVLGGIMALIVRDGFTWPEHPLLTAHGYIWHVILILIGLFIWRNGLSDPSLRGFLRSTGLFFFFAAAAEVLNVALRGYGDCDMFYISPYHLSSQPVFRDIDRVLGKIPGIGIYLMCIVLGAGIIHFCFSFKAVRSRFLMIK